jgi:hypothetical protein
MSDNKKYRLYALSGFIGALLFMTGDCLIYCKTGLNNSSVEPLWSEMSEQRFIISAVLGFIGMSLMLPACLSFYRMIADTCGKAVRILTSIGFIGVASTGYLHFALGTLLPVSYKAVIDNGGSALLAQNICLHWSEILAPSNIVLIGCLCMIYAVHFYVTVSGRSGLNRLTCLVGILGAFAVGMIWKAVFGNTAIGNAYGAFESFGEGLTFLTAYLYWRKKVVGDHI